MTLVNRLSLFFLTALAVVLLGFSVILYTLARGYLLHQVDDRATATLDILSAAVEQESGWLEWDGNERPVPQRSAASAETPAWGVFDERGSLVDGFSNATELLSSPTAENALTDVSWQGNRWRLGRRLIETKPAPSGNGGDRASEPDKPRYRALTVAVAAPFDAVYANLRILALALTGVSLSLWLAAALVGRWLCRRALTPVNQMAQTARAITAADLGSRLPQTGTRDELEDLALAFNDLLGRLQDSFERQLRFTGEASHQLRTPLTAMLGQVEVALRRDRSPDEYRRVLGAVQVQSQQMRQIIEMLLFLAQADEEAHLPDVQVLDASRWLTEHLQTQQQHPRFGDIRTEGEPGLLIHIHANLLDQALDNLLDNACKYSQPGSPIQLRVYREGDEVCIAVEDQGIGMAESDISHLFHPFFRSSDARRRGITGVGLGLAVTSRIISSFGGRIDVTSQPGQGSRFVIRLANAAAVKDQIDGLRVEQPQVG
jgi:two-component system, OmpR family, sensor kinase